MTRNEPQAGDKTPVWCEQRKAPGSLVGRYSFGVRPEGPDLKPFQSGVEQVGYFEFQIHVQFYPEGRWVYKQLYHTQCDQPPDIWLRHNMPELPQE